MAGRFGFGSVGASMSGALEEFMANEEAKRRQAMLDEAMMEARKQAAEDRRMSIEDRRNAQDSVIAQRISENSLPGEEFDAETAALLKRQGFGHVYSPTEVQGNLQEDGETADTRDPNRTANISRGGTKYVAARTAAQEKARLEQEKEAAKTELEREKIEAKREADREKAERAAAEKERDREFKKGLADNANAIRQAGVDARTQAQTDKKAAAEEEKANKLKAVRSMAADTLGVVDKLLTPEGALTPGVSQVVGKTRVPAWFSRNVGGVPVLAPDAANKQAVIDQLQGRMIVDLIGEMKAQSRTGATGFGALSAPELRILETSVARLGQAQDEKAYAQALAEVRAKLQRILQDPDETDKAKELIGKYLPQAASSHAAPAAPAARPSARDFINQVRGSR